MRNKVVANNKDGELLSFLASVGVTESDVADIANHDVSLQEFARIIKIIQNGCSPIQIVRPLKREDVIPLADLPVADIPEGMVYSKFTPSSGAASRMFQVLTETLKSIRENASIPAKHEKNIGIFISGLTVSAEHKFAFLSELRSILAEKAGVNLADLIEKINIGDSSKIESLKTVLEYVLEDKGLNYSNKPKALISFHTNSSGRAITALEEQMVEAFTYGQSKLHLTVSEEHMLWYEQAVKEIKQNNTALESVEVSYSFQAKGTDSPGLGKDGKVFRGKDGKIKFFPAGHGSLVNNLKNTPICIIRNIDNVPNPQTSKEETYRAHVRMLGALVFFKEKLNTILEELIDGTKNGDDVEKELLQLISKYKLNLFMDLELFSKANDNQKIGMLIKMLNRPFRILGVVKNEGEPGGGPCKVVVSDIETDSIVEMDEARTPEQKEMMKKGELFNPVDMVLNSLDIQGKPFEDLMPFVDNSRWFVVKKTDKETGEDVWRTERPGLWNGGMGEVNTAPVELPIVTFGPVKEVNNLITNPQHNRD